MRRENIFSPSVVVFFTLLVMPCLSQVSDMIETNFPFLGCAFSVISNTLPNPRP